MNEQIWTWFDSGRIAEVIMGAEPFFLGDTTYRDRHDRVLVLDQLLLWAKDRGGEADAAAGLRGALRESIRDDDPWATYDVVWSYLLVADDRGFDLRIERRELVSCLDELDSRHPKIEEDEVIAPVRERVRGRMGLR